MMLPRRPLGANFLNFLRAANDTNRCVVDSCTFDCQLMVRAIQDFLNKLSSLVKHTPRPFLKTIAPTAIILK